MKKILVFPASSKFSEKRNCGIAFESASRPCCSAKSIVISLLFSLKYPLRNSTLLLFSFVIIFFRTGLSKWFAPLSHDIIISYLYFFNIIICVTNLSYHFRLQVINVFGVDWYLFQLIVRLKLSSNCSNSFTWLPSDVFHELLLEQTVLYQLLQKLLLYLSSITRLISKLINSLLRVFLNFVKYVNGTSFLSLSSALILSINFSLDVNSLESFVGSFGTSFLLPETSRCFWIIITIF